MPRAPTPSSHELDFTIPAQPDDTTCGPTCLHAIYRHLGKSIPLDRLIKAIPRLTTGGVLGMNLATDALRRGYRATIYSYNLRVFDPTWFELSRSQLIDKLVAQEKVRRSPKRKLAIAAYTEFLRLGGELRFEPLSGGLIRRYLDQNLPILAGLSSTYLYQAIREHGPNDDPDDLRGDPTGHFVVLFGYNRKTREVSIADPLQANPHSPTRRYAIGIDRVLSSILLGVLTYDANLVIIKPPAHAYLIVVNRPEHWPFDLPDVEVVAARTYLTDPTFSADQHTRVYNLCRSYRYQTVGYYVSLLAEARGHRPLPSVATTQDLKSPVVARILSAEVDDLIEKSLAPLKADRFTLSIYFARNTARAYDRLCQQLYNQFQAPLMRATFVRREARWDLQDISAISAADVPPEHREFVAEVAKSFFAGRRPALKPKFLPRYYLAILYDPVETHTPSNARAIQKFVRAAEKYDLQAELITRDDYSRLAEFDALFIRQTTAVNHFTFRFASRAQAEGLVVIDDPQSILRCTNKVFLAELLERHDIPGPKTFIVHRDNQDEVCAALGFPIILKQPDSAFSQGVKKAKNREEFETVATTLFKDTELLIAQEFIKTDFDWRIGVLDRKAIYAAKYFMARKHWQIIANAPEGEADFGKVEAVPLELVPAQVVRTAVKAAALIGDGLYGVDLKQLGRQPYVIEVNDNPSIDAGYEDKLLKDALYERIMEHFVTRLDRRRERRAEP